MFFFIMRVAIKPQPNHNPSVIQLTQKLIFKLPATNNSAFLHLLPLDNELPVGISPSCELWPADLSAVDLCVSVVWDAAFWLPFVSPDVSDFAVSLLLLLMFSLRLSMPSSISKERQQSTHQKRSGIIAEHSINRNKI